MTLAERDAYVLSLLTAVNASGLTGQQAANEVVRIAGTNFIELPALDGTILTPQSTAQHLIADVAALQSNTTPTTQKRVKDAKGPK